MKNRVQKQEAISGFSEGVGTATNAFVMDFKGITVPQVTELRKQVRETGSEYVVIKNTLALRAVNESGLTGDRLRGPTGVIISNDPVGAAKLLTDFAKENDQRPSVKGGLFEGRPLDADQVKKMASMPSREQMLAELGASLQYPMAGFLGAMNGLLGTFAGALEALKAQREGA
jgi:large subunit ribosomal protein L10